MNLEGGSWLSFLSTSTGITGFDRISPVYFVFCWSPSEKISSSSIPFHQRTESQGSSKKNKERE
jgi:hypothetical protein